jgi:hypothetical protein
MPDTLILGNLDRSQPGSGNQDVRVFRAFIGVRLKPHEHVNREPRYALPRPNLTTGGTRGFRVG